MHTKDIQTDTHNHMPRGSAHQGIIIPAWHPMGIFTFQMMQISLWSCGFNPRIKVVNVIISSDSPMYGMHRLWISYQCIHSHTIAWLLLVYQSQELLNYPGMFYQWINNSHATTLPGRYATLRPSSLALYMLYHRRRKLVEVVGAPENEHAKCTGNLRYY